MFSVGVDKNISQLGMNLWLKTLANLIKPLKFRQRILLFLGVSWEQVSLRRFPVLSEVWHIYFSSLKLLLRKEHLWKIAWGKKKGTTKCLETKLAWILPESISWYSCNYHWGLVIIQTYTTKVSFKCCNHIFSGFL